MVEPSAISQNQPSSNQTAPASSKKNLVEQKVEIWKKSLLDLTRRSRLVYFKSSKTSTVQITNPSPNEIFRRLVEDEEELTFARAIRAVPDLYEDEGGESKPNVEEKEIPGNLSTNSKVGELQSQLYRLRRHWKTWQEEQGIHVLYLTLGMLHWREVEHSGEECLAPLILIPVGLEKEKLDSPYRLIGVDEEIVVNPALAFKLENEFGISIASLPDEPTWTDMESALRCLGTAVDDAGWKVTDEIWLTKLSFEKIAMYRDLSNQIDAAASHPVIGALASGTGLDAQGEIPALEDLDNMIQATEVFPILDADSSQLEVLVRGRARQQMIVYGPPGTGKSQTIVNLIAQFLRDGKKILFVSEKTAALEVVFRRLRENGLDIACLELHSHKKKKSEVISELGRTLADTTRGPNAGDYEEQFRVLRERQNTLNDYVKVLHKPMGSIKYTPYMAYGRLARFTSSPYINFDLPKRPVLQTNASELDDWLLAVRRLSKESKTWNNYPNEPWFGTEIDLGKYTFETKSRILALVAEASLAVKSAISVIGSISGHLGLPPASSVSESRKLLAILDHMNGAVKIESAWLTSDVKNLETSLGQAVDSRKHATALASAIAERKQVFDKSILSVPTIREILNRYESRYNTPFRVFISDYRKDKALLTQHCENKRISYGVALTGLRASVTTIVNLGWLEQNREKNKSWFGSFFKGPFSKWTEIESGLNWSIQFRQLLGPIQVPENFIRILSDVDTSQRNVKQCRESLAAELSAVDSKLAALKEYLKGQSVKGGTLENSSFQDLEHWLDSKKDGIDLQNWVSLQVATEDCKRRGLEPFVKSAMARRIESVDLEGAFGRAFWTAWTADTQEAEPLLKAFSPTSHESIVEDFQSVDRQLMDTTVKLILDEVRKRRPKNVESGAKSSQLGILQKEIQKKKRHRPLRRLISETTELLQELKPCMLMSPLSVATYLPEGTAHFDAVIFDEASQVRPEDAIGAILRGDQLIVVGDNKQLPPTDFFHVDTDFEDEDSIDNQSSLESILDECAAIPGFEQVHLNWHYRSRHEELIAFSNREFYENRLITFPTAEVPGSSGAIRFKHVETGVYDRGGSRTNRAEAIATVNVLADHLRQTGGQKSLGIITLSIAQEEAILTEWERRKVEQPDLDVLVNNGTPNEPFFVKSLEKVQGDERDFIFLSIGYGPDQNGIVHMNFGPINRAGGERRLNVAVTRAREGVQVISSMLPHQMDLARLTTGNMGVKALRDYLEYAYKGGVFPERITGTGSPESEFEIWVMNALQSRGYKVDSQIGFSGFRIDLGVRHPDIAGRYILGVECDGATYHSHRTARERDRLRQEVLEKLGWNIYRVWSTDWIRDPKPSVDSIAKRIEELREKGKIGISEPDLSPKTERALPRPDDPESGRSDDIKTFERDKTYGMREYEYYADGSSFRKRKIYPARYGAGLEERQLVDLLRPIIVKEGPIHMNALARRLEENFDIFHAYGSKAYRGHAILKAISNVGGFFIAYGFIATSDSQYQQAEPRVPKNGDRARPIEEIPVPELARAAVVIVRAEFGLPRTELARLVARTMGCSRIGGTIRDRISEAIDLAIHAGMIREEDGQIRLGGGTAD